MGFGGVLGWKWNYVGFLLRVHDDVIKWKHFPRYWSFVRGLHRWPVNFPHKGQWRGALMFYLICTWINGWVNNREAGDLWRHHAHYDVTVMCNEILLCSNAVKYIRCSFEIMSLTHPPGQNGCHFADDIFRCIFVNKKFCILIKFSMMFVPRVQLTITQHWLRYVFDAKPLSVPLLTWFTPDSFSHFHKNGTLSYTTKKNVFCSKRGLGGDALEDVVHEGVHDGHGLWGDTGVRVNLLQHMFYWASTTAISVKKEVIFFVRNPRKGGVFKLWCDHGIHFGRERERERELGGDELKGHIIWTCNIHYWNWFSNHPDQRIFLLIQTAHECWYLVDDKWFEINIHVSVLSPLSRLFSKWMTPQRLNKRWFQKGFFNKCDTILFSLLYILHFAQVYYGQLFCLTAFSYFTLIILCINSGINA